MYYDSKSSFYFKQYGLPIIALVISFALIGIGIYVYWASNTENATNQNLVDTTIPENKENLTENKNDSQVTDDKSLFVEYANSLQPLEKSVDMEISEIKDDGMIAVSLNGEVKELVLIGIDYQNTKTDFISTLKEDLLNKTVKLSFDVERVNNNKFQAYLYIEDKMYNEYILENGLAKYASDGTNKKCEKILKEAQTYAKQLKAGVWAK